MARKKQMDKLAQEASQALAAGMSYGKWKAMQAPVKIEPKPDPFKIKTYICAYCGAEFAPDDNRYRKYCGDRCRKLGNAEAMKERYVREKSEGQAESNP